MPGIIGQPDPTQPDLFQAAQEAAEDRPAVQTLDRAETIRRRDEALAAVDAGADPDWKDYANAAIIETARRFETFTVDQVWVVLDEWAVPRPREGRAMGPRMIAAAKAGRIVPTGDFRSTEQAKSHGQPRRVYLTGRSRS